MKPRVADVFWAKDTESSNLVDDAGDYSENHGNGRAGVEAAHSCAQDPTFFGDETPFPSDSGY